jgi:hypothetical protein
LVAKSFLIEREDNFVAIFENVLRQKPSAAIRSELFFRSYGRLDKTMDYAMVGGYTKQKKGN